MVPSIWDEMHSSYSSNTNILSILQNGMLIWVNIFPLAGKKKTFLCSRHHKLYVPGGKLVTKLVLHNKVTEKTFQEIYIKVGMANCEKWPKQERDDIRFTHIAIPTSFYIFKIIL